MTSAAGAPLGILIANLGTPDAPTPKAVRRYLAEFLSDRRVIALPPILWQPILRGIVLRTRPKRSARLYREVWTDEGSPLLVHSRRQRDALQEELARRGHAVRVALGMRYGQPSIAQALDELQGARFLVALPLYPQFSNATTASTFDALAAALASRPDLPKARFIDHYAHDPGYIDACATQIRNFRARHGARERLLLSFHGLPAESVRLGDPYARQCRDSAARIASALDLAWPQWCITFQSRFGPKKWLTPYTDATLRMLPAQGIRTADVFCPGFSADCLETLQEIKQENQEIFREAGGHEFRYIPALNDQPHHIRALADLVEKHVGQAEIP